MGVILDTNAVSALLAGDRRLAHVLDTAEHHHLPLIVIGEYQFGLLASRKRTKLLPLLRQLEEESVVLCPNRETADWYALICNVHYARDGRQGTLYVRHFLTHAEYDRDDWKNVCC